MDWQQRFSEFGERKTREAVSASLPPYSTEFDAHPHDVERVGNAWSRRLFDGDFCLSPTPNVRRPACHLVFVQSLDGNTVAPNPSLLGGGDTDKHLIYEGLSRVAADGVLSGAETVRGGRVVLSVWHPELVRLRESLGQPRHPIQIVATLRGMDIEDGLMFNIPEIPVVVMTVADGLTRMQDSVRRRPWIRTVVLDQASDLPDAFERMRDLGLARISAIGGRHLATQLVDAGLVQDVYLTTSPTPGGEPDTPIYPRPLAGRVVLRKRGTGSENGVVFEQIDLTDTGTRRAEQS